MTASLRPLTPADAPACDAIMRTLPDFFGHEGGLADCAKAVRTQAGWVALDAGDVVGFATWERRTDETAEVTWMAMRSDRRHQGIGTKLIEAVVEDIGARGFQLVLAMTAARPKDPDEVDTYVPTRGFWKARGFMPLAELDIWETDIALLMVRPIAR